MSIKEINGFYVAECNGCGESIDKMCETEYECEMLMTAEEWLTKNDGTDYTDYCPECAKEKIYE